MVKLPEGGRRDDDAAIRLAKEFSAEEFEQLLSRCLSRANLDARTQTEFVYRDDERDPHAWIKATFDDLNLARPDTVSIPRRITLHVDSERLTPQMQRVAAVVDTKGVDAAQFNREDSDRYIREDDTALCILVDRFESAPTNVIGLLQRHVIQEAPLSLSKFILMIIPRGSEPEKVVGGQGQVEDRDYGIDLRRSQIEETLLSRGLPQLDERLLFFDPLRHFESAGVDYRLRSDSTHEEVRADRDEVWNALSRAITMREDQIWSRVTQIGESLKRIREGRGLDLQKRRSYVKRGQGLPSTATSPWRTRIGSWSYTVVFGKRETGVIP